MNRNKPNYFEIVHHGLDQNKRLYFEDLYGTEFVFPMETYYIFKNALKNYKIFYITCKPNHNIKIPENDFKFLTSIIESQTIYEKYEFSKEVLELKKLQYFDIKKIYDLSINTDKVGLLITHPKLISDLYCFDFFIFVKNDFNLSELFNINFNLIGIESINEFHECDLNIDFFQKKYDFENFLFKDNIILFDDLKNVNPNWDNEELIPELIELGIIINLQSDYYKKYKVTVTPYDIEFEKLKEIVSIKRAELGNIELYKKLSMEKLCTQFWIFHEVILSDSVFCTNWMQLVGGVTTTFQDGELIIDYDSLHKMCWLDIICNYGNDLYSAVEVVYQWKKK